MFFNLSVNDIRKIEKTQRRQLRGYKTQFISKLQEYNEINDMRAIFMSKQIQNILEKLY